MPRDEAPSSAVFILRMVLLVALGVPAVAYVWETINQLLALRFDVARFAITLPVTALLILYFRWIARRLTRRPD